VQPELFAKPRTFSHNAAMTKRWIKEHIADPYVKQAQRDGYVSRAAYKLLEIQQKDQILKKGMTVLELGAAPGGWTQVVAPLIGASGKLVAVDLLPMEVNMPEVQYIQGDFTEQEVVDQIAEALQGRTLDLVLSDMAPNISGLKSVDQPRAVYLVELALDCAVNTLRPGGAFLAKIFQGAGIETLQRQLRAHFSSLKVRKPAASRAKSREVYLLAQGLKR